MFRSSAPGLCGNARGDVISTEPIELRMKPSTVVVGRVISAAGKPLKKFSLLQIGLLQGVAFPQARDVTTSNGRFSETVHAIPDVLVIEAAGHARFEVPTAGLAEGRVDLGDLKLIAKHL